MPARRTLTISALCLAALTGCASSSGSKAAGTTAKGTTTTASASTATTSAGSAATTVAGSSGTSGTAKTLDEAAAALASDNGYTTVQATCIVQKVSASLGDTKALALLNNNGDIATFPKAEQEAALSSIEACITKEEFAKLIGTSISDQFSSSTDIPITAAQANCVGTEVVNALGIRAIILSTSTNSSAPSGPETTAILAAVGKCLPADVAAKLQGIGATTTTTG